MTEPRRFHRVFEFDPRAAGTAGQQSVIRGWLDDRAGFGLALDAALLRLARAVKTDMSHAVVSMVPDLGPGGFGSTWPGLIMLWSGMHDRDLPRTFSHELGHLFDWHVLDQTGRSGWLAARCPEGTEWRSGGRGAGQESFAEAFSRWAWGAADPDVEALIV